jgi:hypothetical protein
VVGHQGAAGLAARVLTGIDLTPRALFALVTVETLCLLVERKVLTP